MAFNGGWAFEGNRLIVVPHAGYGENAYYDRGSMSLQFYWFDDEGERIYPESESGLAKISLQWMLREAAGASLRRTRHLRYRSCRGAAVIKFKKRADFL